MLRNCLKVLRLVVIFGSFSGPALAQQQPIDYFAPQDEVAARAIKEVEANHIRSNFQGKSLYDLIREGNYNQAFADVNFVLGHVPNHPLALQIAGTVSRLSKKISIGVSCYEKALRLYPQYAITHAQYGQFLLEIDQPDTAIEQLKQAIAIDPKMAGGYALLASAYAKKGNKDLAREAADKARDLGFKGQLPAGL